jgi:hypothetical protein
MTQRQSRLILLTIVLTPPVFILYLLIPALAAHRSGRHPIEDRTAVEMSGICMALQQYESECGVFPSGTNAAIFQLLYGTNPFHRDFFNPTDRTNIHGEFLDAWGSPYEIEINSRTNVLIKSAGPNGRWGDTDDYVLLYDGRNAGFVQKPSTP